MQKRKKICLITSVPETLHQRRVIQGIMTQCQKYGYHLAVFGTMCHLFSVRKAYTHGEANIYELIRFDQFDGVIVDTAAIATDENGKVIGRVLERLQNECKKPVISLDVPLADYPMMENRNESVLREMCRHITQVHGCHDILLLTGQKDSYAAEVRLSVFLDELQKEGITVPDERIVYGDFWYTSGERLAQELLSGERPMPEAVIAASDHMALGLIEELSKHGVKIPEELIVLGFEATSEAITGDISLSSFEPNDANTAADAVDAIRQQVEPDAPILPYEPKLDTMFHAGMSCGCQPDLVRSGRAFKDALYLMTRNYSAADLLDHIDIGFRMESYVSEQFTAAETPEDCLHAIFDSTYLLCPFENFFLCLKEDWLDTSRDIADGYPAQMQIVLAASSVGETAFCRQKDAIRFDTEEMLTRMQAESETPSVFYFSPVHFNEKMLGYAVFQRSLTDPHPLNLVYRNWLRFVNNALQMIRVQRRLLHLSVHDEMTGAYNRRGMYTAVEKLLPNAPENASILACVIDMDGLKYINDTFGHDEGDFGIRTVAQAAQKLTGPEEIFVRAGGDEFYILGIGIYDSAEINRRITAFEADMAERSRLAAKPYPLTASIGCSLHSLSEQDSIHNVIRDADAAMYRYKTKRKRNRTV